MARIVILEHEYQIENPFMVVAFARRWEMAGHEVLWHRGTDRPPPGDVAIFHINLTAIPENYRALCEHYPRVINGGVVDISKSMFSTNLITADDPWTGPVIVKTNANFGGLPEANARAAAKKLGLDSNVPSAPALRRYPIYRSSSEVPRQVWQEPALLVERFTPEIDEHGNFCVRVWTFFGKQQRCSLWRSKDQQVKSGNAIMRDQVEPPQNLNIWRKRLGFDFGKFDFVIYQGQEVLLDVNRTPSFPVGGSPNADAAADQLALGLSEFLP